MWPIATDDARSVVGVSVCALNTQVSCAKTAEPIEMPFRSLTHVCPRNHALDADSDLQRQAALLSGGGGTCARAL